MKKNVGYIVGLVAWLAVSCDSTVLEFPENGGIDPTLVHVNLSLEVDPTLEPYTTTQMLMKADGSQTHDVRWIIEIFQDAVDGTPVARRVLSADPDVEGHHAIETTFDLHAAKYQVVAWMDYVDDGSIADKYYVIPSLSSIRIPETENYIGDEDYKDTYVGHQEIDLSAYRTHWNSTVDQTVILERPMAKIEFITTDMGKVIAEWAARRAKTKAAMSGSTAALADQVDVSSWQVNVEYAGYFPSSFNAYTNKPNDARQGVSFVSAMTPLSSQEARFGSDYIFVNGNESAVNVNLTISDAQGNVINEVQGIQVPIVRGKLTSVRDEFLTRSFTPGIGIDPGFDGEINVVIPE